MSPLTRRSNAGGVNQPMAPGPRSDKVIMVGFITLGVSVVLYFALGMPGMDHSSSTSTMDGMDMSSGSAPHRLVDPVTFEAALADPDAVVINVHVPYEGEIEGTDLFLQYDKIDPASLPSDPATPLVVYCRSGSMSAEAVVTLAGLGYTNILELDGGMNAWRASGREVTSRVTEG